jgi:Rieske Fe-S protein
MTTPNPEPDRVYPDGQPRTEQPKWFRDFPVDVPEDEQLARREFTKFLVLTSGAFAAGQCWIGVQSVLQQAETHPPQRIIAANEVTPGQVVEFRYPTDADPCLLYRLPDGQLVAFGQKCTHLSCAVIPELHQGHLRCPCHNGYFETVEGRPTAGPPRRPLPRIKLEERGGIIYATGVELRTL